MKGLKRLWIIGLTGFLVLGMFAGCNLVENFSNLTQAFEQTSNHYKVTAELDDWLYDNLKKRYKAGEEVIVKINIAHDIGFSLYMNGEELPRNLRESGREYWQYTFTMPEEDVLLTYKTYDGMQMLPFPTEFSFSLTWGTFGISSYDSETGLLVKTDDVSNKEDYATTYFLTTEEKMQIREILLELNMLAYPEIYNPTEGMGSSPSQTLILSVKSETLNYTITARDVAYSEGTSAQGQKFMDACEEISDILTATEEWRALPDYPYLYD